MADNVNTPLTGSGDTTALIGTKEVSFSGETAQIQLLHVVSVTGSEGSYTLNEISDASGLQVQGAAADGAAVAGNPVLIGGDDGTNAVNMAVDSDGAVHVSDGGNVLSVDWNGTAPPIGAGTEAAALRVTLATDSTGVVSVDDNGGSLTVDGTVTANLSATDNAVLDSIDSAVNGTLTVDLGANNDVTIDNSSIVHTEDTAHNSGDTGIMALAVRQDTLATLASADGDYTPLTVNQKGSLNVNQESIISTNNSTTSTLAGDATFTGTGEDVQTYGCVTIIMTADQDSATDGVSIEFSSDNSNWDHTNKFTYFAADNAREFVVPVIGQYFRVVYTNGSTPQGAFRLQTIFHGAYVGPEINRVSDDIPQEKDAIAVKSVIFAQQAGSGDFINVGSSASGNLKVSVEEAPATDITLAANDGVDIGDVDVTSVVPGTGATALGKAEDAAHSTGDTGVMSLAVRNDTLAALAGTDGDYAPFQVNASGALYIQEGSALDVSGATVTTTGTVTDIQDGAGTSVGDTGNNALRVNVVAGSAGGTEYTEDAAAPANPAGSAVALVRQDTPASLTSADGDIVAQRATDYGAAYVQILDSSGNFINTFGGSGGTAIADDAAFTIGTTQGTPAMGLRDDSADTVEDHDVGVLRMDSQRRLMVSIEADNAGIGGGTQYAEDDAHNTGDTGTMALVVRNDTLASLVSADGDYAPLQVDASGALYIQEGSALDVSAATVNIQEATPLDVSGATVTVDLGANNDVTIDNSSIVHAEDAAHNTGDAGVMSLAVRNDTLAALATTDGDYAPLQVNASGALFIQEGAAMDVSAATVTVDNGGTFAVQVDAALPAGDNNIGNVDIASSVALDVSAATVTVDLGANNDVTIDNSSIVHAEDAVHGTGDAGVMSLAVRNDTLAALAGTDGDYAPFQVNASGALYIQEGSALDVSAATVNIQEATPLDVSGATVTVDLGANNDIHGTVADDAADSGNPVKVGAVVKNFDATDPGSASAEGDRVDLTADDNRRLYVNTTHPNYFNDLDNQSTAQTNTQLHAAPGAGLSLYITDIIMSTDTAGNIKLVDDTAGTPADIAGPFYFAANGGISSHLQTPLKVAANTDIGYTSSMTGNHTVQIYGYIAP